MEYLNIPPVGQLAAELAVGRSPVELYEAHSIAARLLVPAGRENDLKSIQAEIKARIQFAWELARADSIRNRIGRKP